MPDLPLQVKIDGLLKLIEIWEKQAETGRRPGAGVYADKRLPELRAALARLEMLL